jgi:TolB protein
MLILAALSLATLPLCAAEAKSADVTISRPADSLGFLKPIPVSISGFSGEVDSVLKSDLIFMGIENVSPDQAKFLITGNNASRVEGRVVERINKNQLLAKAYTGGSLRAQTHAFADDIAQVLTGKPGIAQRQIAFKVETGGGVREVYIADYDGFNARPVTQDRSNVTAPSWAGRDTLFYSSYKLGSPQVYSHHLPSGARRALTRFSGSNISPAVSPDGSKVAMILSKSGNPELYVCDADGNNFKQLTTTREAESSPCWSPDSRTICYVSREDGPSRLYTVSASGGGKRRIVTAGVPSAYEPDWSPDGKWIIFTTLMGDFNLCLVEAAGGRVHVLVAGEDASWAPNSRAVIFCRGRDGAKRLSLLDVPTKHVKDVARISESNSQPCWAK